MGWPETELPKRLHGPHNYSSHDRLECTGSSIYGGTQLDKDNFGEQNEHDNVIFIM